MHCLYLHYFESYLAFARIDTVICQPAMKSTVKCEFIGLVCFLLEQWVATSNYCSLLQFTKCRMAQCIAVQTRVLQCNEAQNVLLLLQYIQCGEQKVYVFIVEQNICQSYICVCLTAEKEPRSAQCMHSSNMSGLKKDVIMLC